MAKTIARIVADQEPDPVHDEKYPEHAKMRPIREQSQAIGDFLAWMQRRPEKRGDPFIKIFGRWRWMSTEKMLAEYFGVDLLKLDDEKRAMIAELRGGAS